MKSCCASGKSIWKSNCLPSPAQTWEEAGEKGALSASLFASSLNAQRSARQMLIARVLEDFVRLSSPQGETDTAQIALRAAVPASNRSDEQVVASRGANSPTGLLRIEIDQKAFESHLAGLLRGLPGFKKKLFRVFDRLPLARASRSPSAGFGGLARSLTIRA